MKLIRLLAPAALALACAAPAFAAGAKPAPPIFPRANFDTTCAPCRDFDQFASGGWKRSAVIPATNSNWGAFSELAENNQIALDGILRAAANDKAAKPGSPERMVGDYFAACMDSNAAEAAGLKPVQPLLSSIDAMKSPADLPAQVAWLHAHGVRGVLFNFGSGQDIKNSDRVIAQTGQGGLSLPDRDYYLKTDSTSRALVAAYVDHVARTLVLGGASPEAAKADAGRVLAIETALAKGCLTNVQRRDPKASYHFLPFDSLRGMAPSFDWSVYLKGRGRASLDSLNISHPGFLRTLEPLLATSALADWQAYLRWKVLDDASPTLTEAFGKENFAFASRMSGARAMQPRWKRCQRAVDGDLGDQLGQLYVQKYFTPEARRRALTMVENLEAALADRLVTLEWMSEATKKAARVKLDAFAERIGYPDKWRSYEGVTVTRSSWYENRLSANQAETARNFGKIGKPVDRGEWRMTPPTVNAFYSPTFNSINFPAGILQPPFYSPDWDDAVNYGAIGAVIGHEMTHGFDDQGRQFDAAGNLRDWWKPEDAAAYTARANQVEAQFSSYTVLDTMHVNGKLTLGENIADLGGVALAYAAFQKANASKPQTKIDGFTPEQRFFLGYAGVWRRINRDESLRTQVLTDPHSPSHWRVNGPLSNLDEFAKAFGCKEGDEMVRKQELRARIW